MPQDQNNTLRDYLHRFRAEKIVLPIGVWHLKLHVGGREE